MKNGFAIFFAVLLTLGGSWIGFVVAPTLQLGTAKLTTVLVTGDINYEGSESNINFVFGQLATLDMPVIMTAGNHERTGWHRYLRVFGARNHRTDLGPLTILSLDSAHGRDQLTASSAFSL